MRQVPVRAEQQHEDVRVVEITGKEVLFPSNDGHIGIDVVCPFHFTKEATCRLHFGLDGNGRWMCRLCGGLGRAEYNGDDNGKRIVTLSLEGMAAEEPIEGGPW